MEATAVLLGAKLRGLGKLTTGKPYWRHFGAKFCHFVDDVEAKSGYGDFKWVLASLGGLKCKDRSKGKSWETRQAAKSKPDFRNPKPRH